MLLASVFLLIVLALLLMLLLKVTIIIIKNFQKIEMKRIDAIKMGETRNHHT